jgi:phosphohistidine phosphatase
MLALTREDVASMLLILLRHGPAGKADPATWPDDSERPLTPRGEERTRGAAAGLARLLDGEVREIQTSRYARCARTAEIASEALGCPRVRAVPELEPGEPLGALLEELPSAAEDDVVVLVGHEPDLGKLAGTLVIGKAAALPLKKAGACGVHFDGPPAPGKGRLVWHVTPRILRRLAGPRSGA